MANETSNYFSFGEDDVYNSVSVSFCPEKATSDDVSCLLPRPPSVFGEPCDFPMSPRDSGDPLFPDFMERCDPSWFVCSDGVDCGCVYCADRNNRAQPFVRSVQDDASFKRRIVASLFNKSLASQYSFPRFFVESEHLAFDVPDDRSDFFDDMWNDYVAAMESSRSEPVADDLVVGRVFPAEVVRECGTRTKDVLSDDTFCLLMHRYIMIRFDRRFEIPRTQYAIAKANDDFLQHLKHVCILKSGRHFPEYFYPREFVVFELLKAARKCDEKAYRADSRELRRILAMRNRLLWEIGAYNAKWRYLTELWADHPQSVYEFPVYESWNNQVKEFVDNNLWFTDAEQEVRDLFGLPHVVGGVDTFPTGGEDYEYDADDEEKTEEPPAFGRSQSTFNEPAEDFPQHGESDGTRAYYVLNGAYAHLRAMAASWARWFEGLMLDYTLTVAPPDLASSVIQLILAVVFQVFMWFWAGRYARNIIYRIVVYNILGMIFAPVLYLLTYFLSLTYLEVRPLLVRERGVDVVATAPRTEASFLNNYNRHCRPVEVLRAMHREGKHTFTTRSYDGGFGYTYYAGLRFGFPVTSDEEGLLAFLDSMRRVEHVERLRFFAFGLRRDTPRHIREKYFEAFPPVPAQPLVVYPTSGNLEDTVPMFAMVCGVLKAVYEKDVPALLALLASNPERTSAFLGLIGSSTIPDVITAFWSGDDDDADFMTRVDAVPTASFWDLRDVLPSRVKHTPLVIRLTALASALVMSQFGKNTELFKRINAKIDLSTILEKTFTAALLVQVLSAVWGGYKEFAECGDPMAFFGVDKDILFIQRASELLQKEHLAKGALEFEALVLEINLFLASRPQPDVGEIGRLKDKLRDITCRQRKYIDDEFVRAANLLLHREKSKDSVSVIESRIAEARNLLDKRSGAETGEISKLRDRLFDFIRERETFVESLRDRLEPMVIFTVGEPGTGKTTLTTGIMNLLAKVDGVERYPGDFFDWKLEEKYPAENIRNDQFRYVVFNDITDDYSNYPMLDRKDFVATMQELIDTVSLSIRAAAVEKKGHAYAAVRYIIVNANWDSYLFSMDATKLSRRFASGMVTIQEYKDSSGKVLDHLAMTSKERASAVRFVVAKPVFDSVRMMLKHTEIKYTGSQFFRALVEKSKAHWERAESDQYRFRNSKTCCPCGIAYALHEHDGDGLMIKIFPNCEDPNVRLTATVPTSFELTEVVSYLSVIYAFWHLIAPKLLEFWKSVVVIAGDQATLTAYESFRMIEDRVPALIADSLEDSSQRFIRCMKRDVCVVWLKIKKFARKYARELAVLVGVATSAVAIYKNSLEKTYPSGPVLSRYTIDEASMLTPVKETLQVVNPGNLRSWAKTDPLEHIILQKRGVGYDDLERICRASVAMGRLSVGHIPTKALSVKVVFISSQYILLNEHYLRWNDKGATTEEKYAEKYYLELDGKECCFSLVDVIKPRTGEMCKIPNFWRNNVPSLESFYLREPTSQLVDVAVLGETTSRSTARLEHVNFLNQRKKAFMWANLSKRGDCGTPVLGSIGKDWFILGFVSLSADPMDSTEQVFFRQGCFQSLSSDYAVDLPVVEDFVNAAVPTGLETLSVNSEFRAHPTPFMVPFGTDVASKGKTFRSKIVSTRMHDDFACELSEPYGWPTKLDGMVEGEHKSAWSNTVLPMNAGDRHPYSKYRDAMMAYLDNLMSGLRTTQPPDFKLAPLSLTQAMFGLPTSGIDGVVMRTSLGPYWRERGLRCKNDLFTEEEGKFRMNADFVAMVNRKIRDLKNGVLTIPNCEYVPKDEVRPLSKLLKFKIRLFSVIDFDFNIIMRMYLMPLVTVLLQNRYFSFCFGGMNAGSTEWTDLKNFLDQISGDGYSDADFSSFDSCHWRLIQLTAEFFWRFALACGYNQEDAAVTYFLVYCLVCQLIMYKNDYFLKMKGLISGVIVTLILNSLVNCFLMIAAFAALTSRNEKEFFSCVRLAVVGDDNLHKISQEVISEFNMAKAKQWYAEAGYYVTPASKNGEFKEKLDIGDATFLKRSFVLWEDGYYRAPLNKDSLWKSFMFQFEDAKVSAPQRLHDVYTSNVMEAYMHGRDFFESFVKRVDAVYEHHKVPHETFIFSELNSRFLNGSFTTFACGSTVLLERPLEPRQQLASRCKCTSENDWRIVQETLTAQLLISQIILSVGVLLILTSSPAEFNFNDNTASSVVVDNGPNTVVTDGVRQMTNMVKPQHFLDDKSDDYRAFVTQPTLLHHVDWTPTSTGLVFVAGDLVRHYLTVVPAQLRAKWNNFSYFRGKIKLKVVVQGSPQMGGQMVVAAYPLPKSTSAATTRSAFQFVSNVNDRVVPHVIVDPGGSDTYEMSLPLITTTGWYDIARRDSGSYMLVLRFLTPLFSGTSTNTNVRVCIYMNIDEPELVARTIATGPAMQEMVRTEPLLSEVGGWIGGNLRRGVTLFSRGVGVADNVLKAFGFSKPVATIEHTVVMNRTADNYSQIDGQSHALVLGASQTQTVSIDPAIMGGSLEDMSIKNLVSKPGMIHSQEVLPATLPETFVVGFAVHPVFKTDSAIMDPPTPLSGVALAHTLWRGSINYTFEFVASVYHRATFMIAWDPNGSPATAPTFDEAVSVLKNTTIYVSGNTSVDISVPYSQPRPASLVAGGTIPRRTNGAIYLYLVNPVASNGGTRGVFVNVLHRSEDMALMLPDIRHLTGQPNYVTFTVPTAGPMMDWAKSMETVSFGTSSNEQIGSDLCGDVSVSIKDITSRASPDRDLTNTTAGDNAYLTPAFPSPGTASFPNTYSNNFVTYFARAFVGVRGSLRLTVGGIEDRTLWVSYDPDNFNLSAAPAFTNAGNLAPQMRRYAITATNNRVSATSDVIIPFVCPELFRPTTWAGLAGSASTNGFAGIAGTVQISSPTGFPQTQNIEIMWSTGDDFVFSNFIGFPIP